MCHGSKDYDVHNVDRIGFSKADGIWLCLFDVGNTYYLDETIVKNKSKNIVADNVFTRAVYKKYL